MSKLVKLNSRNCLIKKSFLDTFSKKILLLAAQNCQSVRIFEFVRISEYVRISEFVRIFKRSRRRG